jgi:exo-1,4-beta-D-glucosaminidase
MKSSADFRSLNNLSGADLQISHRISRQGNKPSVELTITNKSPGIAFFIDFAMKDSSDHTVYPVFWEDNYLSLLPQETRTIRCVLPDQMPIGEGWTLSLSGWNVKEQIINIVL